MRLADGFKLLVCIGATIATAMAQTQQPVSPMIAAGQYAGEAATTNQLVVGLGATAVYDDNAFNTAPGNGQAEFGATPRVSWDVAHSHWSSMLDYSAQIMRSERFDFYNTTSHSFDNRFSYQFNKNLSFDVGDRFLHTADPLYNSSLWSNIITNPGSPNPSFLGQPAVLSSNFVNTDVQYRLDAQSDFTLGGSYSFQRYSNTPNASLRDSNAVGGNAAFHHAFSARMKSGVSYDVSKITTPAGYETFSQRILANEDITLTPTMMLSAFGGPNHISNRFAFLVGGIPAVLANDGWSWSAGGTYTWTRSRISMSGSIVRQVSDGGGLVGTVRLTSFQYSMAGKLPHKLSGSLHAGYNLNDRLLLVGSNSQNPKYGSAGATLTRNLRRDLTASVSYARMEQVLVGGASAPWIDRDRVTIAVNYSFTHPLGR